MKRIHFTLILLLATLAVSAQFQRGRGSMNRGLNSMTPQNQPPSESQIKDMERKAELRREEFVANFLTTLDADAFQKEIIKQSLDEYLLKVKEFKKVSYGRSLERKDAFNTLRDNHFKDLKELISENDMTKIYEMLDGKFEEKEVKKKGKQKKRKKKKK